MEENLILESRPTDELLESQISLREEIRVSRFGKRTQLPSYPDKLVSIIVVNYNGEKLLRNCLNCLLSQSHQNIEVIVVDNGSTDNSLGVLTEYQQSSGVKIVELGRNSGVAGGRNAGVAMAQGQVVAFIDNDGYADKDWIASGLSVLLSSPEIGATASLVFFASNKTVLNGAGGTMNFQGYAGDLCYNQPYEIATISDNVLYPMGCGMLIRTALLDRIFPLDDLPLKWFDDTEVGLRIWRLGLRVVVAPDAWIDHDFHTSESKIPRKNWQRAFDFEKVRIRQCLKYLPLRDLVPWLGAEAIKDLRKIFGGNLKHLVLTLLVWGWNIIHLKSIVKIRHLFPRRVKVPKRLFHPSEGQFPLPTPDNRKLRPDLSQISGRLAMKDALGESDSSGLLYGWFDPEQAADGPFRLTTDFASVVLKSDSPTRRIEIHCAALTGQYSGRIIVRPFGSLKKSADVKIEKTDPDWEHLSLPVNLAAGRWEIVLISETVGIIDNKRVGLAISSIELT